MDPTREWPAAQSRVVELVRDLTDEQAATTVPACPDWTVRELLAHVVGAGVDVVSGNEVDDHNAGWTQGHVERRRDASIADLVAEWEELTGSMVGWMKAHPDTGSRPVLDVTIHEQDLRGALGVPGARENEGLQFAWTVMTERVGPGVRAQNLAPMVFEDDGATEVLGSGGSADEEPGVVLRAPRFELLRAILGRRSADQVRAWVVRGDVEPYLAHVSAFGALRETDLVEPEA